MVQHGESDTSSTSSAIQAPKFTMQVGALVYGDQSTFLVVELILFPQSCERSMHEVWQGAYLLQSGNRPGKVGR